MNEIQIKIKNLISENINMIDFQIIDESHKHANHKKDTSGGHFKLFIVSDDFENMTLINRHKLIYDILGDMIKTEIHALSMKLLENITDGFSENDWKYFDWKELQILDQKVIVSRSGFTNELGWEIYFRPENETEKIGDYILEEGKKLGMILVATPGFRCRRIEAGLLSAGQDFTKKTNPFSVGLGRFINFDKEDFIGKEALMTSDKKCKTWGIRVAEGTAIKGESIKINEKNIGKITSSTWSPYQICGVGIVHLDNNENGPGDVVDVKCTDGKVHKGEICKLPMYDAKGEIVRGLNRNIPKAPNPWPGIKTTN